MTTLLEQQTGRRPLRVTFCAYDWPDGVGGPLSWLGRLLPLLIERGIDARCLFLTWGEGGPTLDFLRTNSVPCENIPCHTTTEERILWILERLSENPPDVFVPNLVIPAYFASRWIKSAGIPTVGILHSDDAFYRGIQDEFVFGAPEFAVSSLVCVSKELENQVNTNSDSTSTGVIRIPYGVAIPAPPSVRADGLLRIAFVGRLAEEQKRISEVTRAFCKAARQVDEIECLIYGDGPDRSNVERILEQEAQDLPVHLRGRIPSEEVQSTLAECDVIVLLSDYEGLPIALLEAMACGCVPVCMRMRSGIPELVTDGVTGLVVEDREESFVSAIHRLRGNEDLRKSLSRNARSLIQQNFSIDANADAWADLLISLIRDSSIPQPIETPHPFNLPPVHDALSGEDPRHLNPFQKKTSLLKKWQSKISRIFQTNH